MAEHLGHQNARPPADIRRPGSGEPDQIHMCFDVYNNTSLGIDISYF